MRATLFNEMIRRDKEGNPVKYSWIRKYFLSYISYYIVILLRKTRVSAIHVSEINLVVLFLAVFLIAVGFSPFLQLSLVFIFIFMLLDVVDGDLARSKKQKSRYGGWLDHIAAYYWEYLFILAASVGWYRQTGGELGVMMIFPITLIALMFIHHISGSQFQLYLMDRGMYHAKSQHKNLSEALQGSAKIVSKEYRQYFMILCIAIGVPGILIVVYTFIYLGFVLVQFVAQAKILRQAGYYT